MGAYALAKLRREDLVSKPKSSTTIDYSTLYRKPSIAHNKH